ncbi:MAG: tRNA-(ms[2]io[6]A)-hydroxylase [Pseudomonadales bacterium]|nr:tRNA-(ms[2]io[6]A)-hydroxylase [Pseudomonadales bacterium]
MSVDSYFADPLQAATPESWLTLACEQWQALLVDHANCEKKAASTALSLMFAYPEDRALATTLSRLAREELRHFEQVDRLMRALDVPVVRQKPGRYAAGLRRLLRTHDPLRKLDLLLTGALIEARSCERFRLLATGLPAPMAELYASLERSEARHFQLYLRLADREFERQEWRMRLTTLAAAEAELATSPDMEFRFHSGAPGSEMDSIALLQTRR